MRTLVLLLVLATTLGPACAYPLQGGDENVLCILFGTHRMALAENSTDEILKLDLGLVGAANATYQLVDSKDNVFVPIEYRNLQIGRQELLFQVPIDDLVKLLKVAPSEGNPFDVKWWATPKGISGDVTLRYYGIEDWLIDSDLQALTLEVSITNNGAVGLPIGPQNFSLLDQWGWEYYPVGGFQSTMLEPKMTLPRVKLGFTGLSSQSKPTILAYDFQTANQITIDLEKDAAPLSDVLAYGTGASSQADSAKDGLDNSSSIVQGSQAMANASEGMPEVAGEQSQNPQPSGISPEKQFEASIESLKGAGTPTGGTNASSGAKDLDAKIEESSNTLEAVKKLFKQM
jgi:hypothetical protein